MNSSNNQTATPLEYVMLVAFVISIGALATDLMLPALDIIGQELGVQNENDVHLIVTAFFLGMAGGQLIVGPLSDAYGRKPVILLGYLVFILGCVLSMFAESWAVMIMGRVLQGVGAAAPRIVVVAMIRDEYEGRGMARILSMVMTVFITVPIIAPTLGEGLIYLGGWKATFAGLVVLSFMVLLWFHLRQQETLGAANRRPMKVRSIVNGVKEVVTTKVTMGYTFALGCMNGVFLGYLGSAQQIFQGTLQVGDLFVVYFAIASVSLGAASLLNAKLVMRLGMRKLTWRALVALSLISFCFWLVLTIYAGVPPLPLFLIWQLSAFFCVGIIFGNVSALSLEALGHMAGLGSAFVGSISTFIALPMAWLIGRQFDGTLYPLLAGFSVLGLLACLVVYWTERSTGTPG